MPFDDFIYEIYMICDLRYDDDWWWWIYEKTNISWWRHDLTIKLLITWVRFDETKITNENPDKLRLFELGDH